MKKKILRVFALCLLPVVIFAFLLAGCKKGDTEGAKETYTVSVVGGTGGGVFEEGAACTVTATVPDGKKFVEWTSGGATVSTENPYSFKVTKDITLNAEFEDVAAAPASYTVTVIGGTGGGVFEEGDTCTVTASVPAGKKFVAWTSENETVSTDNPYAFIVREDIALTAKFEEGTTPSETYTVTVIGGKIQGGASVGVFGKSEQVTIVADVPFGKEFKEWTADGKTVSGAKNPYTFSVTGNVTYTAVLQDRPTVAAEEGDQVYLSKSVGGNPIGGFGVGDSSYDGTWDTSDALWQKGEREFPTFAGDPSVMVAADPKTGEETVYLYAGHDVSKTGAYNMPEWICYSSTDLLSWKAESIIMDIRDVPWASKAYDSAWAAQVIEYKGYYWFLFCSWSDNASGSVTYGENGDQCIGVAVSESPTGPFTCFSEPLVYSSWTNNADDATKDASRWNDIDPTGLVTDANGDGVDEFYIAWGNSNCFMAQVEMVTVGADDTYRAAGYGVALEIVDRSATTDTKVPAVIDRGASEPCYGGDTSNKDSANASDWDIMKLDLWRSNPAGNTFTEAPYLYEREGKFYMIYAAGWREALAYSVNDTLWEYTWDYGNLLMDATATSNTNHPAVFDFKGHTYMIYHNGSLPYGSGYRRVACIAELAFDDEGYIDYVAETSTGLTGVTSKITDMDGIPVSHRNYKNPQQDTDSTFLYPLEIDVLLWEEAYLDDRDDMLWELEEAKFVPEGEEGAYYVSIQAYNKAGLYLCYDVETGEVIITQDSEDPETAAALADKKNMTFETLAGKDGAGVQFRCVTDPNFYLASINGKLVVSSQATIEQRTFGIQTETGNRTWVYEKNEGVVFA